MKVGGPLSSRFNFLYQQVMKPAKVTDTCAPTQWFGPMAKAKFPQKTTLNTWWNKSQDGNQVLNDGVAAFNYQPPPCQYHRKFGRGLDECLFIGLAVIAVLVGSVFMVFWRSQIKVDLQDEAARAALEATGVLNPVDEDVMPAELTPAPTEITPPPRPASDAFDVAVLQSLAEPENASLRERD